MTSHILWKNKSHVPNHEPDNIYIYIMTYRDGNLGIYDEADPKCKIGIIVVLLGIYSVISFKPWDL
jgi:hypothetical protein